MRGIPKLIILSEQFRGKSFELVEDNYSCGRVEKCNICIKDPTISSHHCDFTKHGSTYTVSDCGSTNGTRVNNVPITKQELQNSDIVQIGGVEILFDCDDKSITTVLKTQTGINLQGAQVGISTVKKMDNISPFANNKGKGGKTHKIVVGFVIFLVLIVIFLIGIIVLKIISQSN